MQLSQELHVEAPKPFLKKELEEIRKVNRNIGHHEILL